MDYSTIRREYIHKPLIIDSLNNDPMVEFQRWFAEAYQYFGDETNAMSLATSDKDGHPSVRIVLLKGLTKNGFLFYTNYESRKGQQLAGNPVAALLFYWPGLDRQIRIEGSVHKISEEESDLYFKSRPIGSQISTVISPQSKKITETELQNRRSSFDNETSISRPDHWGGYEVKASYFEFWNGRENRFHDRIVYEMTKEGTFDRYRIAP